MGPSVQYLVFLEPLFKQLFAALLQHRSAQLQGLKLVELALIQQDAKVLEQGRGLALLGRDTLEAPDGVGGAQDALQGGGGAAEERGGKEQSTNGRGAYWPVFRHLNALRKWRTCRRLRKR